MSETITEESKRFKGYFLYFDPLIIDRIDEIAKSEERSRSYVIRKILCQAIDVPMAEEEQTLDTKQTGEP